MAAQRLADPAGRIPDGDGSIAPRRGQPAVGAEGHAGQRADRPVQLLEEPPGRGIPEPHRTIPRGRGDPAAVRAEGQGIHAFRVTAQHEPARLGSVPAAVGVPDPEPAGLDRGQALAVPAEGDAPHIARVAVEGQQVSTRRRIPDRHHVVFSAGRGDPLAVGAEGQSPDGPDRVDPPEDQPAGDRLPEHQCASRARGGQRTAIGRERDRAIREQARFPVRADLPAGLDVPDAHGRVVARRGHEPAIPIEGHPRDPILVSREEPDPSGLRLPETDGLVPTRQRDQAVIGMDRAAPETTHRPALERVPDLPPAGIPDLRHPVEARRTP